MRSNGIEGVAETNFDPRAVQYARALGLLVLAMDAGARKGELCRQLGAQAMIKAREKRGECIPKTDGKQMVRKQQDTFATSLILAK